ncbi:DUF6491 family protein [Shewanella sp. GutDb-MelDb]|jgi:hypothetical protein|uniref:DUF6491 family protein n=1 Tax=Shewanella sp. GutDb-MelDb TaxID=2058316 RepID=UPI000C7C0421|nr:DUF6491 family protein [Shewanella sp. GutDb-MelDb]PKG55890.1 hypothetical protein CXF82_17500 [Shewanella sp. GutDb-MelDb]
MKLWNIVVIGLAIVLAGCAATEASKERAAMYEFPELEQVNSIDNFRMDGWEEIDKYSLIVNSRPREIYLLILNGGNNDLKFAQGLLITSTLGKVEVGFDSVSTRDNPQLKYNIKRMYRIKDKAEKELIKQQILAFSVDEKKLENKKSEANSTSGN